MMGWNKVKTVAEHTLLMRKQDHGWEYKWHNRSGNRVAYGWVCGSRPFAAREARKTLDKAITESDFWRLT